MTKVETGPELDWETSGVRDENLNICEFYHPCLCHKASWKRPGLASVTQAFLCIHHSIKNRKTYTTTSLLIPDKRVEDQSLVKDPQENDACCKELKSIPLYREILYHRHHGQLGSGGLHFPEASSLSWKQDSWWWSWYLTILGTQTFL
jgi:hypothetical protein